MTRFAGVIGYDMGEVESAPGVWTANIVERILKGTVQRDTRQVADGTTLNGDISTQHTLNLVADEYAMENYVVIRYAVMNGVRWKVDSVEFQRPRIILRLGRRYNGPTPPGAP